LGLETAETASEGRCE